MAKIKESALVAAITGSAGGNTFARNKGGAYVRQKVSPTQPQTERQSAQRSIFTVVSQAWRNLTDPQRAQWEAWAANHPYTDAFGNTQLLSGNAAFMRVNGDILTLGLDMTNTPLADPTVNPPGIVSVAAVAATGVVTATLAAAPDADDVYAIWTTRGLSPGVAYANNAFKFGGPVTLAPPASTASVTPKTFNPLMTFNTGEKVGVILVRYSQDGAYIDAVTMSCIAT